MSKNKLKYVVVGYGRHARYRIIPQLIELKLISAIVSSKILNIKDIVIYKNIKEACKIENKDNIFILCTPPKMHFNQAKILIRNGFNFLIEKPIFLKESELREIIKLSEEKKIYFNELFMYKYTRIYKKFLEIWKKNKKNVSRIEIIFTIPSFAEGTYRSDEDIKSSLIYDIGCYPISLLTELEIDLRKLFLYKVFHRKNLKKRYFEVSLTEKINIKIKFGIRKNYCNEVKIALNDFSEYIFTPFFHGVKGSKTIKFKKKFLEKNKNFADQDAFRLMFMNGQKILKKNNKNNKVKLKKNIIALNNVIKQYNNNI